MKQLLLLIGACCASLFLSAQTITVADISTLQPLQNAILQRLNDPQNAVPKFTDSDGKIDLGTVSDKQLFSIDAPGYEIDTLTMAEINAAGGRVLLMPKAYQLDEVVMSASRFAESASDVAQTVQVIKAKDIAFASQGTMADVVQNTGNVMMQKSQLGGGSPIIRGFEANKVLMVVDGVRMNNAIYRGGHLQNIITMDNATMENVEIVFGPGSVMYGSDALGGVMHFFTKNPTLSTSGGLKVKANTFLRYASAAQEKTAHADISLGTTKFGSLTSFTITDFNDLRQGSVRNPLNPNFGNRNFYADVINGQDSMVVNADTNLQVGSGYTQYDVLQKFLYQQNSRISHTLNIQFSTSSDVPRYDRLATLGGSGLPTFAEWYYGPQRRMLASYALKLSEGPFYDQGRITLAYQNIEESRHDRRFNSVNLNNRIETLNIMSLNADFNKEFGKHELRYGLEGTYNDVASNAFRIHIDTGDEVPLDTRYPNGGSNMQSMAAYLSHAWEISPKFILNDGVRFSNVGLGATFTDTTFFPFPFNSVKQNNSAVNGNLGLVAMPGHDWRFTLTAASGFRAPNVDDLSKVFDSQVGSIVVPNPDLKPEYTYNLDFGFSKTYQKFATIGATAFYTLYQNPLTTGLGTFLGQDSIPFDGQLSRVLTTINGKGAYLYGVNAYCTIVFSPEFSLNSTFNYTYGRLRTDTTDYPLDHIPPTFGRTSLQWKTKKFRAEVFAAYSGWKRLKDFNVLGEDNFPFATPVGMPAWFTLNIRTAYQINPKLQAQVSVENILDQNYRVFASNISAPGRNFIVTLRANL